MEQLRSKAAELQAIQNQQQEDLSATDRRNKRELELADHFLASIQVRFTQYFCFQNYINYFWHPLIKT